MIKTLVLAAALAASAPTPTSSDETLCRSMSELGGSVMRLRQQGLISRADMEVKMRDIAAGQEQDAQLYLAIVRLAWTHPQYGSQEYRQTAIMQFRDEIYSLCLDK